MGCAGRVANGINTVHLSYVREKTGHALAGARQWIPAEDIKDPVKSPGHGTAAGPAVPHQGRARHRHPRATRTATGCPSTSSAATRSTAACTALREFLEGRGQAYVLRVASNFTARSRGRHHADLRGGGEEAAEAQAGLGGPLRGQRGPKASGGTPGPGSATASPRHSLLVRRHLKTGELAFHYCFVPGGQLASKARLIRAAGLRWPAEESFELGKGCFGLDQCQARLYTAILRHIVLVMAALAVCAVTAAPAPGPHRRPGPAARRARTPRRPLTPVSSRSPSARSGDCSPARLARPKPPGHAARWLQWRRRHQARSRWFHKHARLHA